MKSQVGMVIYATETYSMHFPEPAQFLNVPVLAGRKVNFTLRLPLGGVGSWALALGSLGPWP